MNTLGVQKPFVELQVCLTGPDGIESMKPVCYIEGPVDFVSS